MPKGQKGECVSYYLQCFWLLQVNSATHSLFMPIFIMQDCKYKVL